MTTSITLFGTVQRKLTPQEVDQNFTNLQAAVDSTIHPTPAGSYLLGTTAEQVDSRKALLQLAESETSGVYLGNTANPGSRVLDWYEEGTWTPAPVNVTVVGTSTFTGTYTRIGRRFFASAKCVASGGSLTFNGVSSYLAGLPFNFSISEAIVVVVNNNPITNVGGIGFGGRIYPAAMTSGANVEVYISFSGEV